MLKLLIIFLRRPQSFIRRVETIDGSANEGEDYIAVNEILTFEPYETEKEVGDTLTFSLFPLLSSDRCDNCGRQPVGARRGVLPQVDDATGLGVSAVNLSPFCQLFVTIVNFCLLQLFWSTWSTWSAGPRERRGQAGQDQHHGDHDPQR